MKKFYAFAAAALMSASLFAAAPTAADLAKEYDVVNNVVFCIQFIDDAANPCNDVRFVGTPNNWGKGEGTKEAWDNCEKFAPVPGFDGWYAAELPYSEGFQGKPLQEPTDRSWTWDYQCGDKDAWVHVDGGQLDITAGYADECNIAASAAGAYIYQLKYWKKHKTPCVAVVKHQYKITLYAPDACKDMKPAISGDDMGWGTPPIAMNEGLDDDFETVYTYSFEGQEGHGFKIREANDDENWSNQMQYYVPEDTENDVAAYWSNFDNIELTADSNIVLDWSDNTKYRFALCDGEETVEYAVSVKVPTAGAPAAGVEIIGTFDKWAGTMMTWNASTGYYDATVQAKPSQYFKFREAGTWDNEILQYVPATETEEAKWEGFADGELEFGKLAVEGVIALDFSDPAKYAWKAAQGIENVVLTEKVQKVVVDGVLYIIRDNKMYNVHGAQVR